ncbi:MAG: hypothetical protein ACREDR_45640, partial [Blastocatellia bacterium]
SGTFSPGPYTDPSKWADAALPFNSSGPNSIDLDSVYPQIVKNSWVVLDSSQGPSLPPPPPSPPTPPSTQPGGQPVLDLPPSLPTGVSPLPGQGGPGVFASKAPQGSEPINPAASSSPGPGQIQAYLVIGVDEEARADFNISGKSTRVTVSGENLSSFSPRNAAVYGQSELLQLAEAPVTGVMFGDQITLSQNVVSLEAGQQLMVVGKLPALEVNRTGLTFNPIDGSPQRTLALNERLSLIQTSTAGRGGARAKKVFRVVDQSNVAGVVVASGRHVSPAAPHPDASILTELVTVKAIQPVDANHTEITLTNRLVNTYDPTTVTIFGNVVAATNGETTTEVLGSGDPSQPFQSFTLRQSPLTYT